MQKMEVDPETYHVSADGAGISPGTGRTTSLRKRYSLFETRSSDLFYKRQFCHLSRRDLAYRYEPDTAPLDPDDALAGLSYNSTALGSGLFSLSSIYAGFVLLSAFSLLQWASAALFGGAQCRDRLWKD